MLLVNLKLARIFPVRAAATDMCVMTFTAETAKMYGPPNIRKLEYHNTVANNKAYLRVYSGRTEESRFLS